MSKRNNPDTGQSEAGTDTSGDDAAPQDMTQDPRSGQGDVPKTGPFAHDPSKVPAPPNPTRNTRLPEAPETPETPSEAAPQESETRTGPAMADESEPPDTQADPAEKTEASQSAPDAKSTPEPAQSAPQHARPDANGKDAGGETVTIRQGGFWSMLFGGALAASIGVVASPYILSSEMLEGRVPAFLAPQQQGEDEVEMQLAAQDDRLAGLETRLDELSGDIRTAMDRPAPPPDISDEVATLRDTLGGIENRIAELEGQIGDTEGRIGDLGNRLTAVETRPIPTRDGSDVSSSEIESLRARLEGQRADMEAQRSNIETLGSEIGALTSEIETQGTVIEDQRDTLATQADTLAALRDAAAAEEQAARETARATLRRAAVSRVMTTLDTGSPFDDALADLRETGVEVPQALADVAESGVPTMPALVDAFPDAARAALSRTRDTQDTLGAVEIGDFFRSQLGMRSLVPREGDDPDAVLSRAESALRDGRIAEALSEIDNLPENARAEMDDWVARATQRQEALSAANALADSLN